MVATLVMGKKHALVTGCNTGLGLETVRQLVGLGQYVVHVACRDDTKTRATLAQLGASPEARAAPGIELDDLASVARFAASFNTRPDADAGLHLLVANAGVMAIPTRQGTKPGNIEKHVGVNHLGHMALILALEDQLLRGARASGEPSRVVVLSSHAHLWLTKKGTSGLRVEDLPDAFRPATYSHQRQYALSKWMNIAFVAEANRRWSAADVPLVAYAVHPGVVATEIARSIPFSSMGMAALRLLRMIRPGSDWGAKSVVEGVETTMVCSTMAPLTVGDTAPPLAHEACVQYWSDGARVTKLSRLARDEALARALWDLSMRELSSSTMAKL